MVHNGLIWGMVPKHGEGVAISKCENNEDAIVCFFVATLKVHRKDDTMLMKTENLL